MRWVIESPDKSEIQIVKSLKGREDWKVLKKHAGRYDPHSTWDGKNLVSCEKTKGLRQRQHESADAAKLLERIETLEAQVKELQAKLSG